ncbi:MAG: hypothetical protein ACLPSO_17255, partial [Terracidiphilus sp.]
MSDTESMPPIPAETLEPIAPVPEKAPRPGRLRRFFLRHLPLSLAGVLILLAITLVGLYFAASSATFENFVRRQMTHRLETATGGRVEIASFHWRLLSLEAEADGLVIHGLEAPGESPYAQVEQVRVRFSVLGFLSPRIQLRDLDIVKPQLHLIVYPDGSTNQPQPRKHRRTGMPMFDRFLDLKADHVTFEQGALDYENRAAEFDFQNRHIPLDFAASDFSLRLVDEPAKAGKLESYLIEAGIRDLKLSRGASSRPGKTPIPVQGFIQATLELTRNAATMRSLRITASGRGIKDRTLEISGTLENFAHPRWMAKAVGELDLRLIDPITGYPFTPEGIAHLDLTASGDGGSFRSDGGVHIEGGSYIGTGVVATGFGLDAHVHADPRQLLITSVVVRLRQGGQIEGDLSLAPWLSPPPTPAKGKSRTIAHPLPSADVITIPVNGKVVAQFKDVAVDTILEMVCDPPFQHLSFDTRVNGPANALWVNGDDHTVSVGALFSLTPPAKAAQGKVLASGLIDA